MIKTILRINWLNLKRDYVALGLSLVLPIVFFSIFAAIFGNIGSKTENPTGTTALKCVVLDLDQSAISKRFIKLLKKDSQLEVRDLADAKNSPASSEPLDRQAAWLEVRKGHVAAALVFPKGFGENFGFSAQARESIELIYDPSDPIARFALSGLLQGIAMQAAPDVLMDEGLSYLEQFGGDLTLDQKKAVEEIKPFLQGDDLPGGDNSEGGLGVRGLVSVKQTSVRENETSKAKSGPDGDQMVSYYAAAIAVMFLLFSMSSAGGSILEEEENGTLERILTSKVTLTTLLMGKWVFFSLFGFVQVMIMFAWAAQVFGLPLWEPYYLSGCILVSVITAATASAFGLFLAVLCRSRAQLGGISTIVILVMSAMGGSMVPKFVMPVFMQKVGQFTVNGQALEAFLDVFWRFDPQQSSWTNLSASFPHLGILSGMTLVCLIGARLMSKRWETL